VLWLLAGIGTAQAHSFGTPYNLPVPFWMYAYGATATLAVSFAIVAYFAGVPVSAERALETRERAAAGWRIPRPLSAVLRGMSVALLLLSIATGLIGTPNIYSNFNMTFFWLVFALGFLYVTALIGDVYGWTNPWRAVCDAIARLMPAKRPLLAYPRWLGYYPALVLYAAFIWLELFAHTLPVSLAIALIAYTLVNLAGAALFGRDAWFRYGEFFAVMFRLVALMAPVVYREDGGSLVVSFRKPLAGLLAPPAATDRSAASAPVAHGATAGGSAARPQAWGDHLSLLLFVLFMLSSTAFDGLHETLPWVTVFWKSIFPVLTAGSSLPYTVTVNYYYYWQWAMLLVSPFIYLAIYAAFVVLSKWASGSARSVRELAMAFTLSLVPIAFVYNVTHYFTLLASQGVQIVRIASDPFGFQWNLFGTATLPSDPIILDAGTVWHTQVALILIGHILGVYVSHVEALRVFRGTRRAIVSQLPMLMLMILFTTAGLWILSLPIAGGQVLQPPPS
jgi:hypothetical protein